MPQRKMRVELFDEDGNKYTIAFEGQITRDKAVRLLDLAELLGGMQQPAENQTKTPGATQDLSKFERVFLAVRKSFPLVWFSSREMRVAYEEEFKEPISLSTVATYLTRLTDKGALLKAGPANNLRYRLVTVNSPLATSQRSLKNSGHPPV